jgi:phage-related protein
MGMPWRVEALNEQVEYGLLALPADMQARYLRIVELLEEFGPQQVGMPHVRPLSGKLWEMRKRGRAGIARAIYLAAGRQRLVVLHAFLKKSRETPPRAIALACRRAKGVD